MDITQSILVRQDQGQSDSDGFLKFNFYTGKCLIFLSKTTQCMVQGDFKKITLISA